MRQFFLYIQVFRPDMDTSDEHIDIVGDDTNTPHVEERQDAGEESVMDHDVPLTVQITADAEPSGAKKRKPLKTTKLQVRGWS